MRDAIVLRQRLILVGLFMGFVDSKKYIQFIK